jgi:hypothetical protein
MVTIRKLHPAAELETKQPIQDNDTLWRYVPLKTLFCYLSGSIFIPSLQKLQEGDPFEAECLFDPRYFDRAMRKQHGEQEAEKIFRFLDEQRNVPAMETHKVYFDFMRKSRYAWCWFCRERESALMWNTYGHHGAAIRTTVGKLRPWLESYGRDFVYGRMLYVDVLRDQTTCLYPQRPEDQPFLLEPCFLKRSEYRDELEVRFVTTTAELDGGIFLKTKGPDVPMKPGWIDDILLWPGLLSSEVRALAGAIRQLQPTVSCRRSELLSGQEQRSADQKGQGGWVDDLEEFFEEKCRKGEDDVPAALKELLVGANRTAGQNSNTL